MVQIEFIRLSGINVERIQEVTNENLTATELREGLENFVS